MAEVGYVAALVLAGVFGWAGVAKFRARETTARTFRAFGLAGSDALAVGVPVVEIALAVGLVIVPGWAALGALAVLAGFTTILLRAMAAGVDVGCGCFGTARREPVSFVEIVRNGLLAGGAVLAAFAPGPVVPGVEAVIVVSTAAVTGAVVLAMCDIRRRTGGIFHLDLSGGPG
jgi:hypothetical protein